MVVQRYELVRLSRTGGCGRVLIPAIDPIETSHLPQVASVHLAAFPDSALTKLGREAVRRYYEWQIIGPHDGLNIGAFVDGQLVGFCFGGIRRGALGGFLERNRSFLIRRVITHPWLLSNPLFRERAKYAVQRLFGRLRPKQVSSSVPVAKTAVVQEPPAFGILSIAIDPRLQGQGIAQALMDYSEFEARKRGFTKMHLTVHPTNTRAVRFYEKGGWRRNQDEKPWSGSMSKDLPPIAPSFDSAT